MTLAEKLKDQPVEFIKFDFTSDETKSENAKTAKELGLEEILAKNKGTGFVVLVDANTKKSVGTLTTKHSVSDMLAMVEEELQ